MHSESTTLSPKSLNTGNSETFSKLDTDVSIFDSDEYLSLLLQKSSLAQVSATKNKIADEIRRLETAKKTLMSENYGKFIAILEYLQRLHENLLHAVEKMEELQRYIEVETKE